MGRVLLAHPDVCYEASIVQPGEYATVRTLREATTPLPWEARVHDLDGAQPPQRTAIGPIPPRLQDVIAATLVAVEQGKPVLLMGRPGTGKTMTARWIAEFRTWTEEVRWEATKIHSVAGLGIPTAPPFRAPHHTVSMAGLVGDRRLLPGETALAHGGTLFLDEVQEFSRDSVDAVIRAFRDGAVRLNTATETTTKPTRFVLVMAGNPCPCGLAGTNRCRCIDDGAFLAKWEARLNDIETRTGAVRIVMPDPAFYF
jgi:magnesium chelatase family protein